MGLIPAHYRTIREWFAGYLLVCMDGATPEQEMALSQVVGMLVTAEDYVSREAGREARQANKQAVWSAVLRGLGYDTGAPEDGTPAAVIEWCIKHTLLAHFPPPAAEDMAAIAALSSSPFAPSVMGDA